MKKYFFFCFILSYPLFSISQIENYFLEIKKSKLIVGKYEDKSFKPKQIKKFLISDLNPEEIASILFKNEDEKVLYYIHAMWGGVRIYHKNSVKNLNEFKGIDKIISIVWHTDKLLYKPSWELSIRQGQEVSPLFNYLTQIESKTNYFLCHSMGHRIFQGIVKAFPNNKNRFEKVIFAAPDLDIDVFENDLKKLPLISTKITVYVNEKDRALQISKRKFKRPRLGLNAHENLKKFESIKNLEIVNMTPVLKAEKFRLINHTYFKRNKRVYGDIQMILRNLNEERTLIWTEGNYFELR